MQILREPAQLLGFLRAGLVLLAATLLPLTDEQIGVVIAVAAAVFGIIGAAAVSAEKAAPLVAGLVEAVLACAVAFGAHLTADLQGSIMAFAAAGIGMYLRTQVVAPIGPEAGVVRQVVPAREVRAGDSRTETRKSEGML